MSWGAQNRSKDANTPSAAGGRSRKPKLELCGIQPYRRQTAFHLVVTMVGVRPSLPTTSGSE
jgi:hypothetical protein